MEEKAGFVLGKSAVDETILTNAPEYFAITILILVLICMSYSLWKDKDGR